MDKKTNPTPKLKRRPTVVAEMYPEMYTGRVMPISDAFFDKLAKEYETWVKDHKDILRASSFFIFKGIPRRSAERWCKSKPQMKLAHDNVMYIIADRRETLMLQGVIREKSNMYMMHRYDKDWKEADTYWKDLRKDANDTEGDKVKVVVIDNLKGCKVFE